MKHEWVASLRCTPHCTHLGTTAHSQVSHHHTPAWPSQSSKLGQHCASQPDLSGSQGCHQSNTLRSQENRLIADSSISEEACLVGCFHAHSQFEDRSRSISSPRLPLMRCFTGRNHCCGVAFEPGYPEGNFEGNQLLGGSIGLSPLCRTQATQFARQNSD